MENEIQPLPQNEPSLDATNQQGLLPTGEIDHEGAMAKADLFKLGQYSYKLFKKLEDDTQLESWVQAKITKAADYIASVYHYMEYEMKFSEYGKKLDDSDVLSESQKAFMKNKLIEAKSKIRSLKINEAKKTNKDPVAKNLNKFNVPKVEDDKKKDAKSGKVKHKKELELDESSNELKMAALSGRLDKHTDLTRQAEKSPKRSAPALALSSKNLKRSAGPGAEDDIAQLNRDATGKSNSRQSEYYRDFKLDARKDKMKKRVSDTLNANDDTIAKSKPSAGLSKAKKSAVVKKAATGKDIGKPGKNFAAVAKKAGGGEKGEKIAAAAMWKNIKENTEMAFGQDGIPAIKQLYAMKKQYAGTEWEPQINYRIDWLQNQLDQTGGVSTTGRQLNSTDSVLPPQEWARKHPNELKQFQESTEMAFGEGIYEKDEQLDELNLKPWEKKSPFSKQGYKGVANRQQSKMKDAEQATDKADEKDDNEGVIQAGRDWKKAKITKEKAERKGSLAKNESLNESADMARMKELLTRLNG